MEKTAEQKLTEDRAAAEKLLTDTYKQEVRLKSGAKEGLSERTHVHRLDVVAGPEAMPPALILKQAKALQDQPYDPDKAGEPAAPLFNEWAGLQFLGQVCQEPLPIPRFYGGDRQAGFILMEDFGLGARLDHCLSGEDGALAERTMVALSQTVGRMHAYSIGKESEYKKIRDGLGPKANAAAKKGKELGLSS